MIVEVAGVSVRWIKSVMKEVAGSNAVVSTVVSTRVETAGLPHTIAWETVSTVDEAFAAIKSMKIRGAPAIASLAALGIAAELLAVLLSGSSSPSFPLDSLSNPNELLALILSRTAYLLTSRPTAVNLLEALTRIEAEGTLAVSEGSSGEELARRVVDVAVQVWSEDKERNQRIGDNGAKWILDRKSVV